MKIAIFSNMSQRFFSAEYGGGISDGIALTANRENVYAFETFEEIPLHNNKFALQTYNGNYLTADINGSLRTNASEVGAWEEFRWNGAFMETHHGTRLTARIDKELVPIETTTNADVWEHFIRVALESEIPIGRPELDTPHRIGCSIANIFMANHYDYKRFAHILEANRVDLTGINLLSAHWPDMAGPLGTYPWITPPNGQPWELTNFNAAYLDKLYDVINSFHAAGVHVILTLLELYSWSNRKKGGEVPDANLWHWRNNHNGVKWGGKYNGEREEDDETLLNCPDDALKILIDFLGPIWQIKGGITIKIGNEYPEKDLHQRVRDYIKRHNPAARFMVNRNEDTPGQYQNMKIGSNYHMLDHHGWEDLSFLDKEFDNGSATDRPDTFRQFFDKVDSRGRPIAIDHTRVVANSDGARAGNNMPPHTYNWDELFKVHEFCYNHGCSIDHQSQVKMTFNLDDFETDYIQRLVALR